MRGTQEPCYGCHFPHIRVEARISGSKHSNSSNFARENASSAPANPHRSRMTGGRAVVPDSVQSSQSGYTYVSFDGSEKVRMRPAAAAEGATTRAQVRLMPGELDKLPADEETALMPPPKEAPQVDGQTYYRIILVCARAPGTRRERASEPLTTCARTQVVIAQFMGYATLVSFQHKLKVRYNIGDADDSASHEFGVAGAPSARGASRTDSRDTARPPFFLHHSELPVHQQPYLPPHAQRHLRLPQAAPQSLPIECVSFCDLVARPLTQLARLPRRSGVDGLRDDRSGYAQGSQLPAAAAAL
jgi:hypothetical protein